MIFRSLALAGALSAGFVPALAADDALQRYETAFAQKDWLAAVKAADDLVLSRMPAEMSVPETTAVVLMALALSLLATLYPSWRAARLDPVEALRYE